MGIKERKERNRLNMHQDILDAALNIVRVEGHRSLSLRTLADNIEFSPATVYLYFKNKEALFVSLTKLGYQQLNTTIERNCRSITDPQNRLKEMLKTYWHFAMHDRELFLLMQETEMTLNKLEPLFPELLTFIHSLKKAIANVTGRVNCPEIVLKRKCYLSIAIVQGLASLHPIHKEIDARSQSQMLDDAIDNLINSLN